VKGRKKLVDGLRSWKKPSLHHGRQRRKTHNNNDREKKRGKGRKDAMAIYDSGQNWGNTPSRSMRFCPSKAGKEKGAGDSFLFRMREGKRGRKKWVLGLGEKKVNREIEDAARKEGRALFQRKKKREKGTSSPSPTNMTKRNTDRDEKKRRSHYPYE